MFCPVLNEVGPVRSHRRRHDDPGVRSPVLAAAHHGLPAGKQQRADGWVGCVPQVGGRGAQATPTPTKPTDPRSPLQLSARHQYRVDRRPSFARSNDRRPRRASAGSAGAGCSRGKSASAASSTRRRTRAPRRVPPCEGCHPSKGWMGRCYTCGFAVGRSGSLGVCRVALSWLVSRASEPLPPESRLAEAPSVRRGSRASATGERSPRGALRRPFRMLARGNPGLGGSRSGPLAIRRSIPGAGMACLVFQSRLRRALPAVSVQFL